MGFVLLEAAERRQPTGDAAGVAPANVEEPLSSTRTTRGHHSLNLCIAILKTVCRA